MIGNGKTPAANCGRFRIQKRRCQVGPPFPLVIQIFEMEDSGEHAFSSHWYGKFQRRVRDEKGLALTLKKPWKTMIKSAEVWHANFLQYQAMTERRLKFAQISRGGQQVNGVR
jgi:hypothetical protein